MLLWRRRLTSDELRAVEGAILETSAGQAALYDAVLSFALFRCEFDLKGARRLPAKRRRELLREAERFERGEDWRAGNPEAALMVARILRKEADQVPRRSGLGRPSGTAPNSMTNLLRQFIGQVQRELANRRRSDLADTLLNAGKEGAPGNRGTASGVSVISQYLGLLLDIARIPVSKDDPLSWAVDSIRRDERRRRSQSRRK